MEKYSVFKKDDNKRFMNIIYDNPNEILSLCFYNPDLHYIVKLKDGENIEDLQIPGVIVTCDTEDDKDEIVTDYTFIFDYTIYNRVIDKETFILIKDWCNNQAEGCEEAFFGIGVDNKDNQRYKDYKDQKAIIKAAQTLKKKGV